MNMTVEQARFQLKKEQRREAKSLIAWAQEVRKVYDNINALGGYGMDAVTAYHLDNAMACLEQIERIARERASDCVEEQK